MRPYPLSNQFPFIAETISPKPQGFGMMPPFNPPLQTHQGPPPRVLPDATERTFSKTVTPAQPIPKRHSRLPYECADIINERSGIWEHSRKLDWKPEDQPPSPIDLHQQYLTPYPPAPEVSNSNFSLFSNPFFAAPFRSETIHNPAYNLDQTKTKPPNYPQPIGSQPGTDNMRSGQSSGSYALFDTHSLFPQPNPPLTMPPNSSPLH